MHRPKRCAPSRSASHSLRAPGRVARRNKRPLELHASGGLFFFKGIFRKWQLCWPPPDPMIGGQALHWAGTQVRRGSYEGKEPNDGQQETPSERPRLYAGRWSEAWRKAIGLGQGK